jgi:hypothetical protein
MMRRLDNRVLAGALLPLLLALGCKGTGAQKDAAKAAADGYCDCVKTTLKRPAKELASASGPLCEAESKAFDVAWDAVTGRGDDKEAQAIWDLNYGCVRMLREGRAAASK